MIFSEKFLYGIFFALILTILETLGQSILRKFYLNKSKNFILPFLTWFIYGICVIVLYNGYNYVDEGTLEVLWNAGTNTIIPITGIILFNEKLNLMGFFGIFLTLIGGTLVGISQN
tara:strand:+ start:497 stop:844 length:348 start_codon:yes stop_codon:yes gene_type:complete